MRTVLMVKSLNVTGKVSTNQSCPHGREFIHIVGIIHSREVFNEFIQIVSVISSSGFQCWSLNMSNEPEAFIIK